MQTEPDSTPGIAFWREIERIASDEEPPDNPFSSPDSIGTEYLEVRDEEGNIWRTLGTEEPDEAD